ncbi:MAG: acyl-CoA dehydrogenase C-terminal domain-containing protein, partial [Micromonosporaceae bacterium]|nr:acyl-CoA dehydrogenase C-terminal domain-containing protein [Micromonosporaceae bacterium]
RPAAEAATGGHEARPAAEAATGGHEARPAAEAATGRGLSKADRSFYEGKVAAARFFASEVLPRLGADRRVMQSTTLDLMDLPEAAF